MLYSPNRRLRFTHNAERTGGSRGQQQGSAGGYLRFVLPDLVGVNLLGAGVVDDLGDLRILPEDLKI